MHKKRLKKLWAKVFKLIFCGFFVSLGTSVRTCWNPSPLCFGTWVGGGGGGQFNSHAVNNPTSNRKDEHSESINAIEQKRHLNQKTIRFFKKWRPTLLRKVRKSEADTLCSGRSPKSHPTRRNLFLFFFFSFFENSSRGGPREAGQELLLGEFAKKTVLICVIMNIFFCFENSISRQEKSFLDVAQIYFFCQHDGFSLTTIFFIQYFFSYAHAQDDGVSKWSVVYPVGNGPRQSPIDIQSGRAVLDDKLK